MNLATVMTQLGSQLGTITDLTVVSFPPAMASPPVAFFDYPDAIVYDETYHRGMDRMVLPVWVAIGAVSDESARDALALYVNGSGARSIKTVVEAGSYTAFDSVRVTDAEIGLVTINSVPYLGAKFNLDIAGQGA